MNTPRKPLTPAKMLWMLVGGIVLLILTGVALLFTPIWDIEEPSFPALVRPPRPVIADEDNAYPLLLSLETLFTQPSEELVALLSLTSNEPTEEQLRQLDEYLASQEPVIAILRQALARPHLLPPEVLDYYSPMPHVSLYLNLSRNLLSLRLFRALQDADTEGVLDTLRLQFQLANAVLERPDTMIEHMIGLAISSTAIENTWLILRNSAMDTAHQEEIPSMFPSTNRLYDSLRMGMRSEFEFQKYALDQYASGKLSIEDMLGESLPGPLAYIPNGKNAFFKPNKTLLLLGSKAEWNHEYINRMEFLDFSIFPPFTEPLEPRLERLDMENAVGRIFYLILINTVERTCRANIKLLAEQDILRVWLALRRYHRLQGRYPDSLVALVPEFLDSIPLDPFDGKPLRYDAALERVWSVGPDALDEGGKAPRRPSDKLGDLVFGAEGRILEGADAEK